MKERIIIVFLLILLVGSLGWMMNQRQEQEDFQEKIEVTLYKDPYCGCCGGWGKHLESKGYEIETVLSDDMDEVKNQFNVPDALQSCHTALIEGYVIEGHVPEEAIKKLLEEKPDIYGIGMAGMPSGSPGMPGPKEDFFIYEIESDGTQGKLFMKL